MKVLYFIVPFTVLFRQQLWSQNLIGLTGGGLYARSNLTNQRQSEVLSQRNSMFGNIYSYFGGIVYDIKATREFSIKAKLLYINKGWTETAVSREDTTYNIASLNLSRVTTPARSLDTKETFRFSYLELPVYFTFYTPVRRSLLAFGVGPYINYGIKGKYHQSSFYKQFPPGKDTSYSRTRDSTIRFEHVKKLGGLYTAYRFEYGASVEMSFEFRIGICVNASYSIGISNVIKDRYEALQNRHRVVAVGLGYYWKKKQNQR